MSAEHDVQAGGLSLLKTLLQQLLHGLGRLGQRRTELLQRVIAGIADSRAQLLQNLTATCAHARTPVSRELFPACPRPPGRRKSSYLFFLNDFLTATVIGMKVGRL